VQPAGCASAGLLLLNTTARQHEAGAFAKYTVFG
jgi:hypothetical protein